MNIKAVLLQPCSSPYGHNALANEHWSSETSETAAFSRFSFSNGRWRRNCAKISAGCTCIWWGSDENVSGYFGTPSDPQKRWLWYNCDQLSSLTSLSKHSLLAPSPCAFAWIPRAQTLFMSLSLTHVSFVWQCVFLYYFCALCVSPGCFVLFRRSSQPSVVFHLWLVCVWCVLLVVVQYYV